MNNLPITLQKNVFIFNAAALTARLREIIWKEINIHQHNMCSHEFLEWVEPYVARLNRLHPKADARLLTADERDEMGQVAA